ncbi:predicted protein [Aspergillus nidulans FGSC A4]|uniref:Uncharacterized protein n=1 Tax=Emericella nidulans (strain FGSC A4 / ATCC 38163 / CBS 112.46 / NRRL 194 / M139) TaxID=227321 RepID=Q5BGA6_EMENI|nr:hypothetical protein [Aspergillus nidulans FGSC A4]EAA66523.1 predicted protein [Aspergillus nidulans FGSC A4]CBF89514.1 TPA: conserved hypothetical protein [Aspergillus nidulans FGSC A4]|eukprot:XP_658028.1 predicted protein [Aspergillus nidulans FGSC A4]
MSFVKNLQQVQERTVHITTNRATRSLAESRLILAALQKFGEVVHFRNATLFRTNNKHLQDLMTKGENLSTQTARKCDGADFGIYAMFDTPLAARNALDSSPLHVDLSPLSPQARNDATNPDAASVDATAEVNTDTGAHSNIECTIKQDPVDHLETMSRNPYYGPFVQETDHPVYKDLIKQLDEKLYGLADTPSASKKPGNPKKTKSTQESIRRLRAASLMRLWWLGQGPRAERNSTEEQATEASKRQGELERTLGDLPLEKMIEEKVRELQAEREEKEKQNNG